MFVAAVGCRARSNNEHKRLAKPFCMCGTKQSGPLMWKQLTGCTCGEEADECDWMWEEPVNEGLRWVVMSNDRKQVTFHPFYSSGTAAVRAETPMQHNYQYYWEVKMLTETYGTDIMVGLASEKVKMADAQFIFTSLLGQDGESYGLSYTGAVRHNAIIAKDTPGFCRGTIIGVRVDLWHGTLEYYLNRKSQGVSFYNLRRHKLLYPVICSTAAQSSMRLTYSASWKASLLVDAVKILAASVGAERKLKLPPGLWHTLRSHFWLTLSAEGSVLDDKYKENNELPFQRRADVLNEVLPNQYMNGFYVDNVERNYRVVVWE